MKTIWLHQTDSSAEELILFFCGWGTTPAVVEHLTPPCNTNVLGVYDYTNTSAHTLPIQTYKKVTVVAWSMGVWAAERCVANQQNITQAIAVNGTPLPMHNLFGIPQPIFEGTLHNLNDLSREKFDRRMCGGKALLQVYQSFSQRSTQSLQAELLSVYQQVHNLQDYTPQLPWSKAWISERDLIIPPNNQQRYWERYGVHTSILKQAGHYPFAMFCNWNSLWK